MNKFKKIYFIGGISFLLILNWLLTLYIGFYVEPLEFKGDALEYLQPAESFLETKEFKYRGESTALRPPVCSLYFALVMEVFGKDNFIKKIRALQSVANLFLILLIFVLSYLWFHNWIISLISLALSVFFHPFIFMPTFVQADQLSAILLLIVFIVGVVLSRAEKINMLSVLLGFVMGVALLTRTNNIVLLVAIIPFFFKLNFSKKQIALAIVLCYGMIMFVWTPWIIRNYNIFGRLILLDNYAGYNLYLGNNSDIRGAQGVLVVSNYDVPAVVQGELARNDYWQALGQKYIKENPAVFIERIPVKIKAFFMPLLEQAKYSKTGYYLLGLVLTMLMASWFGRNKFLYSFLYSFIYWGEWIYVFSSVPFTDNMVLHRYPVFFINYVNFSFQQLIPFVIVGIGFYLWKKPFAFNIALPIVLYMVLNLVIAIIYVPKMRVRFNFDSYFIILSAYALYSLFELNFKNLKKQKIGTICTHLVK